MGNCFFGAMSDPDAAIKVITSNGGIMEFSAPVTVSFITNEFPGHAIFRSHDLFWKPLSQFEELEAGQSYYLLPLSNSSSSNNNNIDTPCGVGENVNVVRQGHVRSHSVPTTSHPALYRMSLDYQHHHQLKRSSIEAFSSRSSGNSSCNVGGLGGSSRFWKVKLVITPEQLLDILAQEARTKELIESVRMVAKCGVGGGISSSAAGMISDQWSLSSTSWSISSKIDALVGI